MMPTEQVKVNHKTISYKKEKKIFLIFVLAGIMNAPIYWPAWFRQ